jgi:hypothetical protein
MKKTIPEDEIIQDDRLQTATRSAALRNAVGRMDEDPALAGAAPEDESVSKILAVLADFRAQPLTEEEELVMEEFDQFRQEHPFNLASLVDEDD